MLLDLVADERMLLGFSYWWMTT